MSEYIDVIEPSLSIVMSERGGMDRLSIDELRSIVSKLERRVSGGWTMPSSPFDEAVRNVAREAIKIGWARLEREG